MVLLVVQIEGEGPLAQSQNQPLHRHLLQRQREALLRSQPEAAEAAVAAKEAASRQLPILEDQPEWIQQGQLYPHQLTVSTCLLLPCHAMPHYATLCSTVGCAVLYIRFAALLHHRYCSLLAQGQASSTNCASQPHMGVSSRHVSLQSLATLHTLTVCFGLVRRQSTGLDSSGRRA